MNEISLHKTIDDQATLMCGKEIKIQDEESHDNTMEVGRAWIGRCDTVRAYDVALYEAGTDTTD